MQFRIQSPKEQGETLCTKLHRQNMQKMYIVSYKSYGMHVFMYEAVHKRRRIFLAVFDTPLPHVGMLTLIYLTAAF